MPADLEAADGGDLFTNQVTHRQGRECSCGCANDVSRAMLLQRKPAIIYVYMIGTEATVGMRNAAIA
jgi:hypothetical protein